MQADLTAAIQIALEKYEQDPANGRNCLNLGLYYLAGGENQQAEQIYREALEVASSAQIREAIWDLGDFLTLNLIFLRFSLYRSY